MANYLRARSRDQVKRLSADERNKRQATTKADGDKDWGTPCTVCGATPTVHPTELCGPCCFGEAETAGGNW